MIEAGEKAEGRGGKSTGADMPKNLTDPEAAVSLKVRPGEEVTRGPEEYIQ